MSFFLWDWSQTYVVYQTQLETYRNLSLLFDEFQDLPFIFLSGNK